MSTRFHRGGRVGERASAPEIPLPRVPLPGLKESCDRFLEWCAPLLTGDELFETEAAVASFLEPSSEAWNLQAALERYNESHASESWLDLFWRERYLGRRDRIALNANFFFLLADTGQEQVERAAELTAAAIEYKRLLDAGQLGSSSERGRPLSIAQRPLLFSTTRIPGMVQDGVRSPYSSEWPGPSSERHIVVFAHGSIYSMDVLSHAGRAYTRTELAAGLRTIAKNSSNLAPPAPGVGHLTTMPRADWATTRHRLLAIHPKNRAAINTIETALFCLCLENAEPRSALESCDHLLHGNSANRWFDKSLSLIVFANGQAGMNVEHSCLDGATIAEFVDDLHLTSLQAKVTEPHAGRPPDYRRLEFELDASLETDIKLAAAAFAVHARDTATALLCIPNLGRDRAKKLRVSPDGFAQMAYQLAHKRAKGFSGATYESVAMRRYRHGRTEAMRVLTPQALAFVAAIDDPAADRRAKLGALQAAAQAHANRVRDCKEGRAPEQHLWELQMIHCRRTGPVANAKPIPLHASSGWLRMRRDHLSTSSAFCEHTEYLGFGPTSDECIGIGYLFDAARFRIYLSAPRCAGNGLTRFAHELPRAISELERLLA